VAWQRARRPAVDVYTRGRRGAIAIDAGPAVEMARGPACCAEPLISKHQPACKPGFVGHRPLARTIRDGHSSGTMFAHGLEQPTRTAGLTSPSRCFRLRERTRVAVPIRSYSRCGLPCRFRCRKRGALLPHLFTLASSEDEAVLCGTVPGVAPAGCYPAPYVDGARTFLSLGLSTVAGAAVRPTDTLGMGADAGRVKPITSGRVRQNKLS
jgi:hypothetical protein